MRWTWLGHAAWLVEVGGRRVLVDPALGAAIHDGVFEVVPRREVDIDGLRPDVVVVTHAHPDHFDPGTLARLAGSGARLITSDALVERTARSLGFVDVLRVDAETLVPVGSGALFTTRSHCDVTEWGVLFVDGSGSVWDQVDSASGGPAGVRATFAAAARVLARPGLMHGPDAAIVRWCPLLQADAAVSGSIGFPYAAWSAELRSAAATGARTVLTGSCGDRYTAPSAWQNATVYPGTEGRFLRDLAVVMPGVPSHAPRIGQMFELDDGRFVPVGPSSLVQVRGPHHEVPFAPFELPPIRDPAGPTFDADAGLVRIAVWIADVLAPAVERWSARVSAPDLVFVIEVVLPARMVGFTLRLAGGRVAVDVGSDPEHDGLERLAGSVMVDVLDGRSAWGRALLGGWMRSVRRAYLTRPDGALDRLPVPAFLVYLGLSYEQSTARWVDGEVLRLRALVHPEPA